MAWMTVLTGRCLMISGKSLHEHTHDLQVFGNQLAKRDKLFIYFHCGLFTVAVGGIHPATPTG